LRSYLFPTSLVAILILAGGLTTTARAAEATYICDAPDVLVDDQELLLLQLINDYRWSNGVGPLATSESLLRSAGWMSGDMAWRNYLSHTDWFGRPMHIRQWDCGNLGTWQGENIAAGTAADNAYMVMDMWRNSYWHNAELLNQNYRYAGISRFYHPSSTYGWYWVLDLSSD
jgi:uncharacterized protein YkwD